MLSQKRTYIKSIFKNYRSCRNGNVSIIFTITILIILAAVGGAVDISRAVNIKSLAQSNLDAAVLTSVLAGNQSEARLSEIEAIGVTRFETYFNPKLKGVTVESVVISYDAGKNEAVGKAEIMLDTAFMGVFGYKTMPVNVVSVAIDSSVEVPMDISIMLDLSGSMHGAKLAGLKQAVKEFLDVTIGKSNTSTTTRVAFAPFSTSVQAGPFESALSGSLTSDTCVGERSGTNAYTNAPPSSNMFSVQGDYVISNDENSGRYREAYFDGYAATRGYDELDVSTLCPEAEIFPLTGDYDQLKNKLNGYKAAGLTAGHLGIAYSWYLISEDWNGVWPKTSEPGPKATTDKIAILMSDGQFNTYYQSSNELPNEQGKALCDNMKSDGLTIYSVSFDTSGSSEDLLRDCATDPGYFFDTDTTAELSAAFAEIAENLVQTKVRITE